MGAEAEGLKDRMTTLSVLSALVRGLENPAAARDSDRLLARAPQDIDARIRFLAARLGIPEIHPARLAEAWKAALAAEKPPGRRELLDLARRAVVTWEEPDPQIGAWRRAVFARLEPTLSSIGALDAFTPETPDDIRESHIELNPLLADWPRRLLNDREWAYAEAPLEEMEPLPLEEVWVDLRLVTPEEAAAPATGEDLRDALDLRYEERHWRADPLELALERIDGSAILIGAPGSGKTTILKWIARKLITRPEGRFLLPLFIPLRAYSAWKRDHRDGDLFDFGLVQAGIGDARQRELWTNALSYLSGPHGEHVLLLLDGWDEVREEDRPALHREIEEYSHGFSMLLTSRPSGRPRSLPIHDLYEITELAPESIDLLIDRWFTRAGEPDLAAALRKQLDNSLDLRRLARNPFLLTLLCGLALRAEREGGGALPTSRSALYQAALDLVYRQDERRHGEPRWNVPRRRQVERLALWLLDQAPDAPRYVFGPEDVTASGAERDLLDRYLKPSRLLAQWGLAPDAHHFLHTTFQEYLAARSLTQLKPGELLGQIRRHFFSGSWHEIFHFLAGLSGPAQEAFWREMSRLAREPDRFGHLFLRLARFAAEAGLEDGGRSKLGVDLRDGLWAGVVRFTLNALFVNAYALLDPAGLAERVRRALPEAGRRTEALLLQTVGRTAAPEISKVLVDQILTGDRRTAMVALNQIDLFRRVDAEGLARLRAAAASRRVTPGVRRRAIWALGAVRDHDSIPLFIAEILRDAESADDVFFALSSIGTDEAVRVVSQLIEVSDEPAWMASALSCLERIESSASRDLLLEIIAMRSPEHPAVLEALTAIGGKPVHRGSEILAGLLGNESAAELRAAAASALESATGAGVVEALARAAREDPEEEVRRRALRSLERRARPVDAQWLKKAVQDPSRRVEERALALEALVLAAQRFKGAADAVWLSPLAAGEILNVLEKPGDSELVREAARLAFLIGDVAVPRLLELCRNDATDPSVRRWVCESLGRLRAREAVGALLDLLRRAPDVIEDEETLPETDANLARYAARALAAIDPSVLLREPGLTAANALARWALETGSLVFDDHVLGPDGRVTARAPLADAAGPEEFATATNEGISRPDVDLLVRSVGGDESVLMFKLAVLDPRKGPTDEFGPVKVPKPPREFRLDLMTDLDGLSCKDEESLAVCRERIGAKGTTLFRLLPTGLQMWLWILKDRVRTLQLIADDLYLPWELLRLRPQNGDAAARFFLCEALAVTRWHRDFPEQLDLPLSRIALVAPDTQDLPNAAGERQDVLSLHIPGVREVIEIEPRYSAVMAALRSGEFDGWHFVGHGASRAEDPDRWEFPLERDEALRPEDLKDAGGFGRLRPWVFLNGCRTGGGGISLDGSSGWAKRFLEAGAGAFLGTHWSVGDRRARQLADAFYKVFLRGMPAGEALLTVRRERLEEDPATALAYVLYAHPLARVRPRRRPSAPA